MVSGPGFSESPFSWRFFRHRKSMQSGFVILFGGSSWKSWFRALFSNSSTFPGNEGFKHFCRSWKPFICSFETEPPYPGPFWPPRAPLCFDVCMCVHKWLEDIDHHSFLRHQAKKVLSWGSAAADAVGRSRTDGSGAGSLAWLCLWSYTLQTMLLKTSLKESWFLEAYV